MRPGTSPRQNAKYSIYFDKKTGNVLPANLYRPTQDGLHPVPLECSECLSCLPHAWCSCLLPQAMEQRHSQQQGRLVYSTLQINASETKTFRHDHTSGVLSSDSLKSRIRIHLRAWTYVHLLKRNPFSLLIYAFLAIFIRVSFLTIQRQNGWLTS